MAAAAAQGGLAHQYSVPVSLQGGAPRLSSLAALLQSPESLAGHGTGGGSGAGAATGSTLLGKLGRLAGAARPSSRTSHKDGPASPAEARSARSSGASVGSGPCSASASQQDLQQSRGLSFSQPGKGSARVAPDDAV